MKYKFKSAPYVKRIACLLVFALAGCDDLDLPHVFGDNEVPAEVKAEPRVVQTLPPGYTDNQTWPRLGDVPSKPKNFTPQPLIQQSVWQMENDRSYGRAVQDQVENPPAFVPPPPAN